MFSALSKDLHNTVVGNRRYYLVTRGKKIRGSQNTFFRRLNASQNHSSRAPNSDLYLTTPRTIQTKYNNTFFVYIRQYDVM